MTYGNGYLQDIHIDDIVDWKRLQDEWAEGDYDSSLDILNPNNYSNLISKYVSAEYINNLTDRLYLREITSDPSFKQDKIQVATFAPSLLNGEVYFQEEQNLFLTFTSPSFFTFSIQNGRKNWNGDLEWSINTKDWNIYNGQTILNSALNFNNYYLYLRGTNNTELNTSGFYNGGFSLNGTEISCMGNIETLLDWETVKNGQHPEMGWYAFSGLFSNCTSLITPPSLLMEEVSRYGCEGMFYGCTELQAVPAIHALNFDFNACYGMFSGCSKIKFSKEKNAEYFNSYRIPDKGTGTEEDITFHLTFAAIFENTGGSYTGDGEINTTYYTSNTIV